MDYEKKYKEALERAKALHGTVAAGRDFLAEIFPELAESEDERIRKGLIKLLTVASEAYLVESTGIKKDAYLAWLEKQKEQKPAEKQDYSGLNDLERAIHRGFLCAGVKDIPVTIIKETAQDCLSHLPAEWKPQPESLEALMYAIEGEWDKIKPTSYLSRRLEDLYEGLVNTFNVDESLLAELPKTAYTAKDIEELRVLKDKIEASMESPVDKPAEWSGDDEEMLNSCISSIEEAKENRYAYKETDGDTSYDHEISWLKSLRPQYHGDITMTEAYKMGLEAGKASSWKPYREYYGG